MDGQTVETSRAQHGLSLDPASLEAVSAALDAVHQVAWPARETGIDGRQGVLRTLVIYCYARGLYRSGEIELAWQYDPAIRYICGKRPPEAGEIRQFRRRNSESIRHALSVPFPAMEAADRLMRAIKADSADLDI